MATASHDAGVRVICPGCGQEVLQKAMIPMLGEDGQGIRYLCTACARKLVVAPGDPAGEAEPAEVD
jgi:DNA-directed RNA polymerase subunit RPC12/RpoP